MAADSIILEQLQPAASTPTALYTVPAGRRAAVRVFGRTVTAATVALRIVKESDTVKPNQVLMSESIGAGTQFQFPKEGFPALLLPAGAEIRVESNQADTALTANGFEDDEDAD